VQCTCIIPSISACYNVYTPFSSQLSCFSHLSSLLLLPSAPPLPVMRARRALLACLMLALTVLLTVTTTAAAQKLPARDLDALGPGSFSHSLANTQREQQAAAAQLQQAAGIKVSPLSADATATGTPPVGAATKAAKPTPGTAAPTASAKAGVKYGATDKFAVQSGKC
jgi:hypothetical protein